jgi:hypothetical protein
MAEVPVVSVAVVAVAVVSRVSSLVVVAQLDRRRAVAAARPTVAIAERCVFVLVVMGVLVPIVEAINPALWATRGASVRFPGPTAGVGLAEPWSTCMNNPVGGYRRVRFL